MEGAAKFGVSITVSQVGEVRVSGTSTVSQIDRSKEWSPTYTLDEDGLLHQLRATLVQALDAATRKYHPNCFYTILRTQAPECYHVGLVH